MHPFHGLIIGLGNFGDRFIHTRHNYGSMAVQKIVQLAPGQKHLHLKKLDAHTHADLYEFSPQGPSHGYYLLARPKTGMNQSGEAVAVICRDFRISQQDIIVIHDEMGLPLGQARMARSQSPDHHKGLISIEQILDAHDFLRIRLGIGRPQQGLTVRQWVMERFTESEMQIVHSVIDDIWRGITLLCLKDELKAEHFIHSINHPTT